MKNIWQYGLTIIGVVIISMWYTGYNPFAGPGEIGKAVSIEEFVKLKKDKASDGKRIAFIGHGSLSNFDLKLHLGKPYGLTFLAPDGKYIGSFDLYHGEGKNEFFIPAEFKPTDLKLYDNAGNAHKSDENVLVSFTLKARKEGTQEINPTTGEYPWLYDQLRIDPVP